MGVCVRERETAFLLETRMLHPMFLIDSYIKVRTLSQTSFTHDKVALLLVMQSMNERYLTVALYISSNWYFIEQKEANMTCSHITVYCIELHVLVCNCFVELLVIAHCCCFYDVNYRNM